MVATTTNIKKLLYFSPAQNTPALQARKHYARHENFCENLCLCKRILSQEQDAKNQIGLNLCDLLRRQNSVAETKIFTKFLQYTRSDLSPRCVAATCWCNILYGPHPVCDHSVFACLWSLMGGSTVLILILSLLI